MGSYCRIVPAPGDEEQDADASMLHWMGRQAEKPSGPIRDVHVDLSASWGQSLDSGNSGKGGGGAQRGVMWDADMASLEESRPLRAVGPGKAKMESDSGWLASAVEEDRMEDGMDGAAILERLGYVPALRSALKLERLATSWSAATTATVIAAGLLLVVVLALYLFPPLYHFLADSDIAAEEQACSGLQPIAIPGILFALFILRMGMAGAALDVFGWILLGSFISGGSIIYVGCYSGAHAPELLLLPSSITLAYIGAPSAILLLMLPRNTGNRPLFYYILRGVLTTGSFEEADYIQRLDARWNGSAHFRRLLREMTFLWGLTTVLELLVKLLLAFLLPFRVGSLIATIEFALVLSLLTSWSFLRTRAILKNERLHIEVVEDWKAPTELKSASATQGGEAQSAQVVPPPPLEVEHGKVKYAPVEAFSLILVAGLMLPLLLAFVIVPILTDSSVAVVVLSTTPPLAVAVGYLLWRFRSLGGALDALGWTIMSIVGLQSAALILCALTGHTIAIIYLEPLILCAFATLGLATLFPPESLGFKPILYYIMVSYYQTKSYTGHMFHHQMDVRWTVSTMFRKTVRAATLFSGCFSLLLLCIPLRDFARSTTPLSGPIDGSQIPSPLLKSILASALSLLSVALACHLSLLAEIRADNPSNPHSAPNNNKDRSSLSDSSPPAEPPRLSSSHTSFPDLDTPQVDSPLHPVHISFATLQIPKPPAPESTSFMSPQPQSQQQHAQSPFARSGSLTPLRGLPMPHVALPAPADVSASPSRPMARHGSFRTSLVPPALSIPKSRSFPIVIESGAGVGSPGLSSSPSLHSPSPLSQQPVPTSTASQVASFGFTAPPSPFVAPAAASSFVAPASPFVAPASPFVAPPSPFVAPVSPWGFAPLPAPSAETAVSRPPALEPTLSGGSLTSFGLGGRSGGDVDETWASRGSRDWDDI